MTTPCNDPACMYLDAYMCHLNNYATCPRGEQCFNGLLDDHTINRHMMEHHSSNLRTPTMGITNAPTTMAQPSELSKPLIPAAVINSAVPQAPSRIPPLNITSVKPASPPPTETFNKQVKLTMEKPQSSPRKQAGKTQATLHTSGGRVHPARSHDISPHTAAPTYAGIEYTQHPSVQEMHPQQLPQGYYPPQQLPQGYYPPQQPQGYYPPQQPPQGYYPPQLSPRSTYPVQITLYGFMPSENDGIRHKNVRPNGCKYAEKLEAPFVTSKGLVAGLLSCGQPIVGRGYYCEAHQKLFEKKPTSPKPQ